MSPTRLMGLLVGFVALLSWHCGGCGPGSIDPGRSKLVVDRSTGVLANGTDQVMVTVTVLDAGGSPVRGASITLEASGDGNLISGFSAPTDAQGQATGALASTRAETKVLRALVTAPNAEGGVITLSQQVSVQFVPGPAARLAFGVQPSTAQAGIVISPAIQVSALDAQGNLVPSDTINVSVALSSNLSSAILSGTPLHNTVDGTATFQDLSLERTGTGYTLVASATGLTSAISAPFDITAGPPARLAFLSQPESTVSGRVFSPPVRVVLRDSFGNLIPAATEAVTLALTRGTAGATLVGATTVSAVGGVATFLDLSVGRVGTGYMLVATANGYAGVTSAPFNILTGALSATTSTLEATPASIAADGTAITTLKLTARDAQGNTLADQAVSLSATGNNNTFAPNPPSGTTGTNGEFTATLASTTAETKVVTATLGNLTLTAAVDFTPGAPSQSSSSLTASPTSVPANGTSTTALTVVVRDARGNPVPNQAVSFSASGSNNTLSPSSGTTDSSGTFTAALASTRVESKTVTATVGGFTLSTSVTFTPAASSATTSTLTASPTSVTANGTATTTLTVTVRDAGGNLVAGEAVSLSASGTDNTFLPNPPSGTTNASGVFTATLASTRAETKTVTATVGGSFDLTTSVAFTSGSPSATTSTLTASPTSVTANGVSTMALTVVVKDARGNPVPPQTVSLSVSGSNNTLSPSSGMTSASGVFTATLTSTRAEAKTVTATVGGVTLTAPVTFTPGAPSAALSTLTATPTSVTANGTSTSTLTVTVRDANGNPVSGQAVSLSSSGSGNTLTPTSGTTNASGVLTATLASTRAEAKTVTATVGSFTLTTPVTFVGNTPSATNSTLTASPTSLTANGTATSTLTLTVRDSLGNPVSGQAVSLSASGSNNTLTPTSGTTNASGVFTATLASTRAETKTVTATVGSFTLTAVVVFVPGAPSSTTSTLTASPTSVTANGSSTTTLTVTVKDAGGNVLPGQTVSLSSSGSNNTLVPASGTTNASGVFTATLSSTRAETKTITASVAGSFSLTTSVTFVPGPPSATTSTFTANPTSVAANGTATTALTVTVKDAYGNVIPSQLVNLSSTGSSNFFSPSSGMTDASGVFTATLASTRAETKTITATMGSLNLTATVTFTPGPPTSFASDIMASPTSVVADGTATTTLTVTVRDAYWNGLSGQTVSLSSTGTDNTFTPNPPSGTTNASGAFIVTLASSTVENKTITANVAGSFNLTTSVAFTPGPPSATTSTFTAEPASVPADGTATTTLTVTVKDANGNVIPGQTVSLSSTGSNNTFTPSTGTTDGAGVFTATLASTRAEAKTITATMGSLNLTAAVTFTPGAPSATTSTLTASPASVRADGTATTTLTVTVRDPNGNGVPGQAVSLSSTGSNNTFTPDPPDGTTDASGVFTATLASSTAETKTVMATVGSFTLTTPVIFTGAPSATTSTLTASPTSVPANGTATTTLTVTVRDADGNVIPGQAVSLSSTGSNNTFTPASGTTNASGVFTATLASTTAETKTVTATVGGFNLTTTVTFTVASATYSQYFTGSSSTTQCTNWTSFRGTLTGTYSSITIRGTYNSAGITCTGASANTLCNALRTGTRTTLSCGGRTWSVSAPNDCGPDVELSASGACVCTIGYTLRPCYGGQYWGGVNTDTCSAYSQTMTVICQ